MHTKFVIALLLSGAFAAGAHAEPLRADPATLKAHVEFLADDLMEGREPGLRGHDIAARYVAGEFARARLRPGGDAGTFLQRVPLRTTQIVAGSGEFEVLGSAERYKLGEDFFVPASRHLESTDASADLVYAGHGVVAPQLGVDDYAGLEVAGKFVVVLAGSPPFFGGDEAAHFADPRVKQEAAAARSAIGLITLQTPTNEMRLPFAQIVRILQFRTSAWLDKAGKPRGAGAAVPHLATLSVAGAEKLAGRAGLKLADLIAGVEQGRPPRALPLAGKVRIARRSQLRDVSSPNVVAAVEGGDAAVKHEHVVLTSHLDHLGLAEGKSGDNIYNGALDNAMGVAVIVEAARVIAALPSRPRRSILFIASTAEEAGLLGSEYFVNRSQAAGLALVANLNVDMPVATYDFRDVVAIGADNSSIGELIAKAAASKGVPVSPDPNPERRRFTRSDHYSFVKSGIPAAFLIMGVDSLTESGAGRRARDHMELNHYHRVTDDTSLPINYQSAARFADVTAAIALELANAPAVPQWKSGNFFGDTFGRVRERP
jgi:Zn-dependent M28 family amino/carboxypeptidase